MNKTINYLLLLSCFTVSEALAANNCMRGRFPTEKEFSQVVDFKQKKQDKRMNLAALAANDEKYKAELEDDLKQLMDKAEEMEDILRRIQLPTNLSTCVEANFSKEKLSEQLDNWLTMFNFYSNPDYVYNWKLFNDIIIQKSFNTSK